MILLSRIIQLIFKKSAWRCDNSCLFFSFTYIINCYKIRWLVFWFHFLLTFFFYFSFCDISFCKSDYGISKFFDWFSLFYSIKFDNSTSDKLYIFYNMVIWSQIKSVWVKYAFWTWRGCNAKNFCTFYRYVVDLCFFFNLSHVW